MISKKPDICIYHGNCADGFTAAWAVWLRWPNVEFIAHTYGEAPPDVTDKHVLIVDYSFKRAVLEKMEQKAKSITVLDHHKSAEADLKPFCVEWDALETPDALAERAKSGAEAIQAFFDMHRSGAMLTWQFVHGENNRVPKLVQHVQDRDLWLFKLKGTREISAAIFSYDYAFETWNVISDALEDPLSWKEFVNEGTTLERKHFKDVHELLAQTARPMRIGGHEVMVANMPYTMSSDAANILAEGAPFGACYFDKNDGTRSFSLRSKEGGADVSEIAFAYGGGGHARAAGFSKPLGWEGDT
jgi:oligoribonuclease NrnB/cAMP/cGMP phosphodiesterase (DHH superfamily)